MLKIFIIISFLLASSTSFAWISEEIDDHKSTRCLGDHFELVAEGDNVTASGVDRRGQEFDLSGELVSLTIDTEDASLYYKIIIHQPNPAKLRYLTIDSVDGEGTVAVHYSLSQVAGSFGKAVCLTDWLSDSE